ncbi:MAG: sigma-70 family RNA polymerase sigma factor [Clostridia bacterium]|nr:sigma-70 family RNA polymerase sigma factor [Clostridia bacterium]
MDPKTAAAIAEENVKTIFAYALSRVSDPADAEDLAGDIIAAFLESAHKIRDERAVYGFIWSVAANQTRKFYDRRRKKADRQADMPDAYEEIPDPADFTEEIEAQEEIILLRRELALLSGGYRTCTVAYYFDGMSCREISEKYGISVEMVKYYLYKTRRIIREGMQMTREFGEKSYKPAEFHVSTIFAGEFNREYTKLLDRKLPANILYSAYYTPMTIGELAVELGISAVYMEDECRVLEEYGLLKKLPDGRVQTAIFVFTEAFEDEFYKTALEKLSKMTAALLADAKNKLPEVRKIGFTGSAMDDNRMLWAFLFELMRRGHDRYAERTGYTTSLRNLYREEKGILYGVDHSMTGDFGCSCFAGYFRLDDVYSGTMADFGVLPEKNRLLSLENEAQILNLMKREDSPLIVLKPEERKAVFGLLAEEIDGFGNLYRHLADLAAACTKNHAPKFLTEEAETVVRGSILYRTVGLLGKLAVESGALTVPEYDGPVAVFINEKMPADCTGVLV